MALQIVHYPESRHLSRLVSSDSRSSTFHSYVGIIYRKSRFL